MSIGTISKLSIDIVSDVVCPWCYVGKKKLEIALDQLQDRVQAEIRWRPFQLAPQLPLEGIDYKTHLTEKFGSLDALRGAFLRLEKIGKEIGIHFQFESIAKAPNTLRLHALISNAGNNSLSNSLVEAFFAGHFEKGLDLTEVSIVQNLAIEAGMDPMLFQNIWKEESLHQEVHKEYEFYSQNGVSGVPFFIFGDRYAVSGAQNPETFLEVIRKTLEESASSE